MIEPYIEGIAVHDDPESCACAREGAGEALTGVRAGRVLSCEITSGAPTPFSRAEGNMVQSNKASFGTAPSAGQACPVRWNAYDKPPERTGRSGSPPSFTVMEMKEPIAQGSFKLEDQLIDVTCWGSATWELSGLVSLNPGEICAETTLDLTCDSELDAIPSMQIVYKGCGLTGALGCGVPGRARVEKAVVSR